MKKPFYFILFASHLAVVLYFWWQGSGALFKADTNSMLLALGRLSGLLLVSLVFLQVMLMGRARWLEPVFGLDKLARVHRTVGKIILVFLIAHPLLIVYSYSNFDSVSLWQQYLRFIFNYEDVFKASIAVWILLFVVVYSILMMRRKWNFEWWYLSHLSVYIAIILSFGHQAANGNEFLQYPTFLWYWYAVYAFVFGNLALYRFLRPLRLYGKHKFIIEKTVPETKDVTSVYIAGKKLDEFKVKAGQFFIVRFLDKKRWWQAHPFSLSKYPDGKTLRLSIKASGDFTETIKSIQPGTKLLVEGPYGVFTKNLSQKNKVLLIAGGIGITPIRGIIEDLAKMGKDVVLLYANKTIDDTALRSELEDLSNQYKFPIHYVLSNLKSEIFNLQFPMHPGYVDKILIHKYVRDLSEREVYLCGPPPMMTAVIKTLIELGIQKKYIYYEKFSLS